MVTTRLRATPEGRSGLANGSSPLATRSVQSANSAMPLSGPSRTRRAAIGPCAWPDWVRTAQASLESLNSPSWGGMTRMPCVPNAWQDWQAVLDRIDPVVLGLHDLGDAVALRAGAGELVRRRDVQHRVPIHARVILRGGRL